MPRENLFIKALCDPIVIKYLLRKNILIVIAHTQYTKHIRFYLPLPISVTVSIFTAITQHIIISPSALDIQHFVKPFIRLWWDALPRHYYPHICGLISLSSWLFIWVLICVFDQVLFLDLVVNFQSFNSHFSVTTLGLGLFSSTHFNTSFCGARWLRMTQSTWSTRFFAWNGTGAGFWNAALL